MNISEKIILGLKSRNMTQSALAKELGVSRQSIAQWVSGKAMPQADKLVEIINILKIKDEFFPNNEDTEQELEEEISVGEIQKRIQNLDQSINSEIREVIMNQKDKKYLVSTMSSSGESKKRKATNPAVYYSRPCISIIVNIANLYKVK